MTKAKSLEELCEELGFADMKIATARNGDFVPAKTRALVMLDEGDSIEVLSPRQGG